MEASWQGTEAVGSIGSFAHGQLLVRLALGWPGRLLSHQAPHAKPKWYFPPLLCSSVMPSTWCGREMGHKQGNYNEHGLLCYVRLGQGFALRCAALRQVLRLGGGPGWHAACHTVCNACFEPAVVPQTRSAGAWECGAKGCTAPACKLNRAVRCAAGRRPLECACHMRLLG